MAIDETRFRHTMGHLVTGVSVVAVASDSGPALGMTAGSVTSLSLEPPMLLVCVDHSAEIHDRLVGAPRFAISVLAADQRDLAVRFATSGEQSFQGLDVGLSPSGLPTIRGAIARLECRREAVYSGGDHSIVTGVIEWTETSPGKPLCHFRSGYTELAE
jgi:flavin reductase (DIM6/NTAB) family NADH-FMN oxidoreductase RutF